MFFSLYCRIVIDQEKMFNEKIFCSRHFLLSTTVSWSSLSFHYFLKVVSCEDFPTEMAVYSNMPLQSYDKPLQFYHLSLQSHDCCVWGVTVVCGELCGVEIEIQGEVLNKTVSFR